jgi:mannose-1-phosphate guanylyltransferase
VGAGARVSHSVLLPGARVGAHAVVERSAVMGEVGPHARVESCLVGAGHMVASGASLRGARVPEDDAT